MVRAAFGLACLLTLAGASAAHAATFSASTSSLGVPAGIGSGLNGIAAGDLNNDGLPDLVTADGGSASLSLLINGGGGTFPAAPDLGAADTPFAVAVGDLNGDGHADLALTSVGSNQLTLLFADPTGLDYTNQTVIPTGSFPSAVAIGDLNGDGLPDLAVTNAADGTVMLFLATAAGVYPATPTATLTAGNFPSSVAIGDLNGDGLPDLAVTNKNSGTVTLFLKDSSDPDYASSTLTVGPGTGPTSVAIGDLNGDTRPDLAVADGVNGPNGNRVTLFLKDAGDPNYTASTLAAGLSPSSVVIGDYNGDGLPDIAVANKLDNTVSVFLKDSSGSTYTGSVVGVGFGPISLVSADLVRDGRLDLATANTFSGDVTLLSNTTAQASKTTLTASPSSSQFGQTVTFSAGVGPKVALPGAPAATGTVTYTVDGFTLTPTAVSGGVATLPTQELGVGTHTITAAYSGDANYAASTATISYAVTATRTITGSHTGAIVVTGPTSIVNANITGAVSVSAGGSLDLENSTVTGVLASSGATGIRVCGSTTSGAVSVSHSAGLVVIGDAGDAKCAVNTIHGALSLTNNTHGVEAIGNHVTGALLNSGNSGPGPFPGDPTTIHA